ncbi:MAG: sugar ABC transporter permease [Clostridia bacterium]|nr:sugar ABC transporter permease [Clostridia bacterium]
MQSFFQYRITDLPGNFVGFENYKAVFDSDLFYIYFYNTVILFVMMILFSFFIPIGQGLMIYQLKRSRGLFRYLYIFPTGITALAGMSVWKFIWEPDGGLANFVTTHLGLGEFQWLYSEETVKFCLRFPGILGGGAGVVLYLVTLNNVPDELFEAAKIDGANMWHCLRYLELPALKGLINIQLLMSLTGSLLAFDDVYMMTQGGPGYSSTTLVLGAYYKAFREQNFGVSMAISTVTMIVTLIITLIVNWLMHRKED